MLQCTCTHVVHVCTYVYTFSKFLFLFFLKKVFFVLKSTVICYSMLSLLNLLPSCFTYLSFLHIPFHQLAARCTLYCRNNQEMAA